ncbi:unnamed protein product [Ambrosiozyma monospora]|uniref:Unnamed protein product n=1 Tax=Ambrosiozyma monospora TaxID=43982 RepID=A0ACB5TAK5_AMBMO|nr:unnamed protein product [Ambrosiozyma monospora]
MDTTFGNVKVVSLTIGFEFNEDRDTSKIIQLCEMKFRFQKITILIANDRTCLENLPLIETLIQYSMVHVTIYKILEDELNSDILPLFQHVSVRTIDSRSKNIFSQLDCIPKVSELRLTPNSLIENNKLSISFSNFKFVNRYLSKLKLSSVPEIKHCDFSGLTHLTELSINCNVIDSETLHTIPSGLKRICLEVDYRVFFDDGNSNHDKILLPWSIESLTIYPACLIKQFDTTYQSCPFLLSVSVGEF